MRRLLFLLPFAFACHQPAEINYNCTDKYVFGISVSPIDSATAAPVSQNVRLIAVSGSYVEVDSEPFLPGVFAAAGERRGTYDLTVEATGYRTWARAGVVVTGDQCHVHPVHLQAALQPE
jgi:hypothetical protein